MNDMRFDTILALAATAPDISGDTAADAQDLTGEYTLVTAQITYYRPDHPVLLQEFLWQDMDMAPTLPRLNRFIDFWHREIDARLHSVHYALRDLVERDRWRNADAWIELH